MSRLEEGLVFLSVQILKTKIQLNNQTSESRSVRSFNISLSVDDVSMLKHAVSSWLVVKATVPLKPRRLENIVCSLLVNTHVHSDHSL